MAGNSDTGGGNVDIAGLARTGWTVEGIAQQAGLTPDQVASVLTQSGFNVQRGSNGKYTIMPSGGTNSNNNASSTSTVGSKTAGGTKGTSSASKNGTSNDPGFNNPNASGGNAQIAQLQAELRALAAAQSGDRGSGVAAADLNERRREFNITTQRDIAKENASEVDSLQQRLASLTGPKDAYGDYFFSHGLLPPQGYKPAPVPLTQAQVDAYKKMGVTIPQLQAMIGGTGKPGADFGMLGSMAPSLATPPGVPQPLQGAAPQGQLAPNNPTVPGGRLYGAVPPGGSNMPMKPMTPPTTPGGTPVAATGGEIPRVPGPEGTPKLAVLHGGEEVTPAGQNPNNVTSSQPPSTPGMGQGAVMNTPGLHPAISALVDAVSNLLSNPDFQPFVQATQNTNQATAGGVPSMAGGGIVPVQRPGDGTLGPPMPNGPPPTSILSPAGGDPTWGPMGGDPHGPDQRGPNTGGAPQGGAQGVAYNSGYVPPDNPIMALSKMDPYTRALYDIHGRLHPYSAQQEHDMGASGVSAVNSYVGKVEGGDVNAYTDLVNRLKPQSGAPSASTGTGSGGFQFG